MTIRIERVPAPGKLLILGLDENNEVVFNIQLRRWGTTAKWVGSEVGPVVEIDWLEVKQPFRSVAMTFRALCEALTAAVSLADDTIPTIGVVTDNYRLESKLLRRQDFYRVPTLPLPFLATCKAVERLSQSVCR